MGRRKKSIYVHWPQRVCGAAGDSGGFDVVLGEWGWRNGGGGVWKKSSVESLW